MTTPAPSLETPADEPGVQPHEVTVGILTALPVELRAMAEFVSGLRTHRVADDPNAYRLGRVPSSEPGRPHGVALLSTPRDGTQLAATCCAHMLRSFPNIKTVVVTGIAGGLPRPGQPGKHVRLGDIVVAVDGIVNYGNVRQEDGTVKLRGRQGAGLVSPRLLLAVRELQFEAGGNDRRWERWLDPAVSAGAAGFPRPAPETDVLLVRGRPTEHPPLPEPQPPAGMPRVHYGVIGSSDMLMVDEDFRDRLAHDFPDMVAVEMEAAGIAASTSVLSRDWFMVRAIADYGDLAGKNDTWHPYASYAAAAYVRAVLEVTPPLETGRHPQMVVTRPLLGDDDQRSLDEILVDAPADLDIEPAWRDTMRLDITRAPEQAPAATPATPAAAFHYLASRNAAASGLNPAIVFLARLAELIGRRDAGLAQKLESWLGRYTEQAGLGEALRARLRPGSGAGPLGTGPSLVIVLGVDGLSRESFRLDSYIQEGSGPWRPRRLLTTEHVTEQGIEAAVAASLAKAQHTWATLHTADPAGIEFVLPSGLINLPVQWYRAPRMGALRPICVHYSVAVRSRERMHEESVRLGWNIRWARLASRPSPGRVRWGVRYQTRPTTVDSWSTGLSGDDSYVVVVLSEPPDPETELGMRELFAAFEAGVPVILWDHRPAPASGDPTDELRRLTADPATLPEQMRALRVDAAQRLETEPDHYGRSVALLWDDPNRVVGTGGAGS